MVKYYEGCISLPKFLTINQVLIKICFITHLVIVHIQYKIRYKVISQQFVINIP